MQTNTIIFLWRLVNYDKQFSTRIQPSYDQRYDTQKPCCNDEMCIRDRIKEAKDLKEYDNLAASAYLRAKEDYLMGINFSRLLTLKYGNSISNYLNTKYSVCLLYTSRCE